MGICVGPLLRICSICTYGAGKPTNRDVVKGGNSCPDPSSRLPLATNMLLPTIHTVLAARALNITGNVTSTSVVLPYGQPVFAEKLSPQLAAFSIEMDRWPDWSGPAVGQPNQFVNTLLGHLSERTGAPVFLRVGGKLKLVRPLL